MAPLKMIATTVDFSTQTETKVEKVTIDNDIATVIYNTPVTDFLYEVDASEGMIKIPNSMNKKSYQIEQQKLSQVKDQASVKQQDKEKEIASDSTINKPQNSVKSTKNDLSSYKMSIKSASNENDPSQRAMTFQNEMNRDTESVHSYREVQNESYRTSSNNSYRQPTVQYRKTDLSQYRMTAKTEEEQPSLVERRQQETNDYRMMTKVQDDNKGIVLMDRKVKIETISVHIQTENIEIAKENINIEKQDITPVAANQSAEFLDESDDEQDDQNEEDEDQLFKQLDSRQDELGVIQEEDNDESSTFKTLKKDTEKVNEDEKKNQEIANKVKERLQSQVRMSQMGGRGQSFLRDKSIIDKISRIKNFDFLALRSKENKSYKRVSRILERYDEKPVGVKEGMECFTEYIKKIDTSYKRHKRKILITSSALYQLSKNYSVVVRVPLENIKALTLIK